MVTKVAERVVLDTNILLAATDRGRRDHMRALAALNEWPAAGVALYTSGQILREYLSVATRPMDRKGLGLPHGDALANTRALAARLRLLDENAKVSARLLQLVEAFQCAGKQVHDANIVATMLTHGVQTLITMNTADFARFAPHVAVLDLP
jgi:predicted nucleic acid-binding protein